MQLSRRMALITGAGTRIGKVTAVLPGAEGAKVVALRRNESEVQRTAEDIRSAGGEAIAFLSSNASSHLTGTELGFDDAESLKQGYLPNP